MFPEATRELYRRDVDIVVCSALIPEQFAYVTKQLLMARAIETQCYMVFVSGVGANAFAGFAYMGGTEVLTDPLFLEQELFDFSDGDEHLVRMDAEEEGVRVVELDVPRLRKYRAAKTLLGDLEPSTYWREVAAPKPELRKVSA
jgi:predicted amidohydrolase